VKTFEEVFDEVCKQDLEILTSAIHLPTNLYLSEDIYDVVYTWFRDNYWFHDAQLKKEPMLNGLKVYVVKGETNHVKVC